jgi:hypothetical protein
VPEIDIDTRLCCIPASDFDEGVTDVDSSDAAAMKHALFEKAYKGIGMEGFVARWYASLTVKALEDFKALARRVAAQTPEGSYVLEVAPGPGYFAIAMAKLGVLSPFGMKGNSAS